MFVRNYICKKIRLALTQKKTLDNTSKHLTKSNIR